MASAPSLSSASPLSQQTTVHAITSLQRLPGAASVDGVEFEWKVAALVALRVLRRGIPFQLFYNVKVARPCDDLVLLLQNGAVGDDMLFFLQLKHSQKADTLTEQALTSASGDFSVPKYFEFYEKFRSWSTKTQQQLTPDENFLRQVPLRNVRFVIFTTKNVERRLSADEELPHADIFLTSARGSADSVQMHMAYKKVWDLFAGEPQRQLVFREEFLPKLRIFCAQAPTQQLDEAIAKESESVFGCGPWLDVGEVLAFVRAWAEDTRGLCMSEGDLLGLLQRRLQLRAAGFVGDFSFQAQTLEPLRRRLRSAAISTRRMRVCVRGAPNPGFRAAKVVQLLQEEEFAGKWLYVDRAVLRAVPAHWLAAAARRGRILVTDVEDGGEDEKLANAVVEIVNKKVIEVALRALADGIGTFTDDWILKDLSRDSQDRLLQREVIFQGYRMMLRDIRGVWPSLCDDVNSEFLLLLMLDQRPSIGKIINSIQGFLPRTLTHSSLLRAEALTSGDDIQYYLVLGGFPRTLLGVVAEDLHIENIIDNERWEVLYFQGEPALSEFQQWQLDAISQKKGIPVQWLDYVSGDNPESLVLEWRGSSGDKVPMRTFVQRMSEACELEPVCVHRSLQPWSFNTALLVGEAGAGKTAVFETLAVDMKKEKPTQWVILVKILDFRRIIRKWPNALDVTFDHVMELLTAAAQVEQGAGRRFLESALRSGSGISVLLDGVDEVSPAFKDKVIRVLQLLQAQNVTICVSTRPELERPLRHTLHSPSFSLLPLLEGEQLDFLCTFWVINRARDRSEFKDAAKRVVNWLREEAGGLLTSPLHLQMAAEAFAEEMSMPKNFNLLKLYEFFIKKKQDVFDEKYDIVAMNLPFEDFEELHIKCSIFFLFADSDGKKMFPLDEYEAFVKGHEGVLKGREKSGILWMDEAGMLHFTHQSFAEFFAAKWLWRNVSSSEVIRRFVKRIVAGWEQEQLRRFLKLLLAEANPLHAAIWLKDFPAVDVLLQSGLEMNWAQRDPVHDRTLLDLVNLSFGEEFWIYDEANESTEPRLAHALCFAAEKGFVGIVKELLSCASSDGGPQDHSSGLQGTFHELLPKNVLRRAMKEASRGGSGGHSAVVETLQDLEVEAADVDDDSTAVLPVEFCVGDESETKLLMQKIDPVTLNCQDSRGRTFLHLAMGRDYSSHRHQITQQLLQHQGLNIDVEDNKKENPLDFALRVGCEECGMAILQRGTSATSCHLLSAVQKSMINVVRYLVEKGADSTQEDDNGMTPVHLAAKLGNVEILHLLLAEGVCVNIQNRKGRTPLHFATQKAQVGSLRKLLSKGADMFLEDIEGDTALDVALQRDHFSVGEDHFLERKLECAVVLLAHDWRLRRPEENWAQNNSTEMGYKSELRVLLEHGLDPNVVSKNGDSLLHLAVECSCFDIVQCLLDFGACVNLPNARGDFPLHLSAKKGSNEITALLLELGASVNEVNLDGNTPLHLTAWKGFVKVIAALYEKGALINALNASGDTPLHLAVMYRHEEAVFSLLEKGAHVNEKNGFGNSPLHAAAWRGQKEIVKTLLENGAFVNESNGTGATPMHWAVGNESLEVVTLLLENGARVSEKTFNLNTPLHTAASNGSGNVICLLLESGAQTGETNTDGNTPLHLAVVHGHQDAIISLLDKGASANMANTEGNSPLHLAVMHTKIDAIDLLLDAGASVDDRNIEGDTPLLLAACKGSKEAVARLVEKGADVNKTNKHQDTPLHWAAVHGYEELTSLLLEKGARTNEVDAKGNTPLHLAASKGLDEVMALLLERGANIDGTNSTGNTPLHIATWEGSDEAIALLIFLGASADEANLMGNTPLHLAASKGSTKSISLLLEGGALISKKNTELYTALHWSALYGHDDAIGLLLDNGARLDEINSRGNTPLHVAAARGHGNSISLLLKKGAPIDAPNAENCTPLHLAAMFGQKEAISLLLENGASLGALNGKGLSARQVAEERCNWEVATLLLAQEQRLIASDL